MSDIWTKEKERSNVFSLRLIRAIALHLPRWLARCVLPIITGYFLLVLPKVRFASKHYLMRHSGQKFGIIQIAKHIYCFAATILDRVYFLIGRHHYFDIKVVGEEVLAEVLASRQGHILLGAHIGSFDAFQYFSAQQTINTKIAMNYNHNSMVGQVLGELNPKITQSIIDLSSDNALFAIQESIAKGYLVGMLSDRVTKNTKNHECHLLGDKILVPTEPLTIANILQCPVLMFCCVYLGGNKYQFYFKKINTDIKTTRNNRAKVVQNQLQEYVDFVESIIKKHPFNWFNFFDYWQDKQCKK